MGFQWIPHCPIALGGRSLGVVLMFSHSCCHCALRLADLDVRTLFATNRVHMCFQQEKSPHQPKTLPVLSTGQEFFLTGLCTIEVIPDLPEDAIWNRRYFDKSVLQSILFCFGFGRVKPLYITRNASHVFPARKIAPPAENLVGIVNRPRIFFDRFVYDWSHTRLTERRHFQ